MSCLVSTLIGFSFFAISAYLVALSSVWKQRGVANGLEFTFLTAPFSFVIFCYLLSDCGRAGADTRMSPPPSSPSQPSSPSPPPPPPLSLLLHYRKEQCVLRLFMAVLYSGKLRLVHSRMDKALNSNFPRNVHQGVLKQPSIPLPSTII